MKSIKYMVMLVASLTLSSSFQSCDYLAVSDELASQLTLPEVFNNAAYSRRFHRSIYTAIPNSGFLLITNSYTPNTGLDNPWPSACDEMKANCNNMRDVQVSGYHAGNASLSRWSLYKQIRQANIFIASAHTVVSDRDPLDANELKSMMAEARFLKAYYHYLLFELYGPVPIMDEQADPGNSNLDYPRASIDEMVAFLDKELKEVAEELNEDEINDRKGVPTKGTALAVRAKMWSLAASPLLNGEYKEAVALRDNDGKQLFPDKDETKWKKALDAIQTFIDYAASHYELHKVIGKDGKPDVDASLYELFQDYNKEIIWASTKDAFESLEYEGTERRCTPRSENFGLSSVGLTQELVDAFFMKDGLSIKESNLYDRTESGFTEVVHDMIIWNKDTVTYKDTIFNMYVNREPRFYQAITYAGRRWRMSGNQIFFEKGASEDNSTANNCWTGYLNYKRTNRTLYNKGTYPKSRFRPAIIYRLAEFYLLYAEVLNEVNPSDPRIITYVDKVRERAGIPLLKNIKPNIIGNKDLQRKAIVHERRVELCTEGQRYFDVRRWMVAEKPTPEEGGQSGEFHGMNMYNTVPGRNTTNEGYYHRKSFETRTFERQMYLYPIPLLEIQKSKMLVQNPGW